MAVIGTAAVSAGFPAVAGHVGRLAGTAACAPLLGPAAPACGAVGAYAATLGASAAAQHFTTGHVNWAQSRDEATVGMFMSGVGRIAELGLEWANATRAVKAAASSTATFLGNRSGKAASLAAQAGVLVAANGAAGNLGRAAHAYLQTPEPPTGAHGEKLQAAVRELTDASEFWTGGLSGAATQASFQAAGAWLSQARAVRRAVSEGAAVVKHPHADLIPEEKWLMKQFVGQDQPALDEAVRTHSTLVRLNLPSWLTNEHGAPCVDTKGRPVFDFKAMRQHRLESADDVMPDPFASPLADKVERLLDPQTDIERLASIFVSVKMLHRLPSIPPHLDVPKWEVDLPFVHLKALERKIDATDNGTEILNRYVEIAFNAIEEANGNAAWSKKTGGR